MRVSIIGLGHLGAVTTTCVANQHDIKIWDSRPEIRTLLLEGKKTWPHDEPGLEGSFISKLAYHNLAPSLQEAVELAEIVWITYDTPVDERSVADFAWLFDRIEEVIPHLVPGQILLISSQIPAGFTQMVQERVRERRPDLDVKVYCSPENIRRGRALETFCHQKRVLIGVPGEPSTESSPAVAKIDSLFAPFCDKVEWMSSNAAEMSKHVLNAFLAVTIAFANEMGTLCRLWNVDPRDIERSLMSEGRLGIGLPLRYGEPYSGGTLSRDVTTLVALAKEKEKHLPLLQTINPSNELHKVRYEIDEFRKRRATREIIEEVTASAD